ncbi:GEVED domain-containing protein [Flavobacterium sp.]|uniref:Ig-like domain-containing protein n=1 Tax=Flavobacterium sp. TaxID=239 RepID=UPI00333F5812
MINNYDSVETCLSAGSTSSLKQEDISYTAKKRTWLSFVTLFVALFSFVFAQGQNTLISPTGDGGFQNGTTFAANGWTNSSSVNNPWIIGTAVSSAPIAGNSAYISNNGVANSYTTGSDSSNFFWRDITVPAGETFITLSFNWICQGESIWDNWQVFYAPTTVVPSGSTTYPGSGAANVPAGITGATWLGNGNLQGTVQTATINLPASLAGTTFRLIFHWKNDSGGTQPPASIDNISLTSRLPVLADAAPITFTATAVTQTGMTLNWVDNSTNETGFRVYRSTDNITFTQVGANILSTTSAGTGTAYTSAQTGLTFGTTYYYRIVAYVEGESAPLLGTQATLSPVLPTCVTTPFPADAATGVTSTPVITWVGNGLPAPTYDVYFSTNATLVTNKTASVRVVTASATASYTPAALTLGATYYWMVVPTSTAGGPSSCSVYSFTVVAPATFTTTAGGGLWSNAATWVGGVVPPAGNDVSIPAGSIVTADQNMSYRNLDISGILQWNGTTPSSTTNALTIANNLTINSGGRLLAYSTAFGGSFINVAGNFVNNGYANLAYASLQFNGTGSTLSGTGTFEGDGTRGFIRALTSFSGNNIINTTQDLTLIGQIAQTAGTLNTNGKLRIDNTAMIHGANLNTQVASVAVTAMGSAYSVAPIVFGTTLTHWVANTTGTQGTRYVSGNNVYVCIGGNIGATAPTHTTGVVDNLLWLGTIGTLGTPYPYNAASTAGTQYFYGDNLYLATAANLATANTDVAVPVHTSGVVNNYLYVGSVAKVSVNYDATSQTVRSLALTNAGSGYASAPSIAFTVGVNAGTGSGAAATVCVIQSLVGGTYFITQKSGQATLTGGLTINSDQNVSALSANPQASSGIGDVFTTNGGANYTVAPQVGFSGPTALNLVTSGGSGYTAAPTITVTGGTQPAGATALVTGDFTITVNQGKVVSVYLNTTVTKTYITPPTLAFTGGGGGTGATLAFPTNCWPAATAVIGTNRQITNFTVTNSGFGYVAAPSVAVGNASATPTGGTYTTAITAPTARIAAYQLQINFFTPATAAVTQLDDAYVPSSRKMHALWLSGAGSAGMTLTDNLTLISSGTSTTLGTFPPSPLVLTASGDSYGNILNLGTKNLNFTWNGYAGTTSTFGATKGFVRNGTISLMGRGGSGTFNFPFSGTVAIATGTTPTTATTGSDIINLKVSDTAAPTNGTNGTGLATGSRAFKVETATVLGAAGTAGTNPTITLNYNSQDALTSTQNDTFVAESTSLTGPWNIRSAAVGLSGALAATGSRATATTTPGPITLTNGNHYAWASATATIDNINNIALCANSGTFTITGANLTGVTAVNIGGTPVTAFTVVNATTISGFAGNGSNGVVSITKNGGTILGTQSIVVSPSPSAPAVTPAAPSIVLGATVNLTATGTTGTMNWYTTATGGTPEFTGNIFTTPALCSTTTYYVAENNGSCDGARQAVTVTVQPTVITSSVATFCGTGGNAVLSVSPVDPSITYTWTALTSGATLSATTGSSVTATMAVTSDFKVDAVSGACTTSAFYSVGVYPLPTANVTTTADGVCPGTAATIESGLSAGNFTAVCIPAPTALATPPASAVVLTNAGTAVTTLSGGSLDDGFWNSLPIGFSFNFFGTNYTTLNVATNGTINFGATGATQFSFVGGFPNASNPANTIAVCARDLQLGATGGNSSFGRGKVTYWTEGVAPNRRLIVQYDNCTSWYSTTATDGVNSAEAVFYETLGTIDIRVIRASNPAATTGSFINDSRNKFIGLQNGDKTIGATAPNCTTNAANFWNGVSNEILTPLAWRFAPPSNYTTVWTKTDSAGTSTIASGTNIFSQSVSPLETTTYSISYTNQTTGCANPAGSAQVTMAVLDGVAPTGITTTSTATGPLCAGEQVTFNTNFTGSPDGKTMQWEVSNDGGANFNNCPNGFFALSLGSPTHAYTTTPTQAGIYRCKITACNGTPSYSSNSSVSFAYNITSITPATRCGVGTLSLAATSDATAPTDVKWYATATSTTALGTGLTFTTPSLSATTTYFVEVSTATCNSVRVPVVATINPAPALTISVASVSLCAGASSSAVTLTAGSSDYSQFVWSPSTGVTGNESTGWIFNPTQTTTYTLTASQATGQLCSSVVTLPITVNAIPPVTVAASLSTICEGTSTTLTATSEMLSSGPSGLPAVYCVPSSLGASNISSVTFNTLSNAVTQVAPFYDIYPATGTNTTTVTAGQTYALNVQSDAASIASVWIDFNRDGVYDASEWTQLWTSASSGSVNITIPANATAGQTGMRIRTRQTGNTNGNTSACISMGSGSTQDYTIRIESIADVSPTLTYAWSPSTGLSSTGGTFVTASPLTTTTYTVTATSAEGCSASQTIPVNVIAKPLSPVAVPSSQCGTQQPTASVTDPNNFSFPVINWYASNTAATPLQSSILNTYTNDVSATTTFYVSLVNPITNCESSRTPVLVTVTIPDLISATTSSAAICLGESITLTSVNTASTPSQTYTYAWSSQDGSGIVNGTPGSPLIATPTAAGTYTITATGTAAATGSVPQCVTTSTVTVVVNALPVITTATANPSIACAGSTIALEATIIENGNGNVTVGSGATTSTSAANNPFYGGYGGVKTQYLFKASELTALGLSAGNITSLGIDITSAGSTLSGFGVNIGATSLSALTTNIENVSDNVYSGTFTPSVGVNTINFSTPYNWDGTSNIILSFCWSNGNTFNTASNVKVDTTPFVSANARYVDSQTATDVCSYTGSTTPAGWNGTSTTSSTRPMITFAGIVPTNNVANYNWSWTNGATNVLNTASGTTVVPTGATTTYTVTSTIAATGCSSSQNVLVSTNVAPLAISGGVTPATTVVCIGSSATLSAVPSGGCIPYTYAWSTASGPIAGQIGSTLTVTPTATTVYTVTVTDNAGTIVSSSSTVTVNNPQPTVVGQTLCANSAAFTLTATPSSASNSVNWFASPTSTAVLASTSSFTTPLLTAASTTYYVEERANEPVLAGNGIGTATLPNSPFWFSQRGVVFTATKSFKLVSAEYYSQDTDVSNTVSIRLLDDATGTQVASTNVIVPQGANPSWYTMNINFDVVPGTYRLLASYSESADRVTAGVNYPYSLGTSGSITTGYNLGNDSTSYNYFHNITIQEFCNGTRVPVTATLNAPPAFAISGATTTICEADTTAPVTVITGATDYDQYTWSPATGVTSGANGWTFNPTTTTSYTLTASQSAGVCSNLVSYVVNVNPLPTAITITPAAPAVCVGSTQMLTAAGGNFVQNAYTQTMEVSPSEFGVTGGASATLDNTYYSQGSSSLLFTTANTDANERLTLNQNVDLNGATSATVTFSHIAGMEQGWDFGFVQYSSNGGDTWDTFSSTSYVGSASTTVFTGGNARFCSTSYTDWNNTFTTDASTPGTGPATSLWKTETFNVPAAALTSQFRIRFRYTTDSSTNYYGWLIDNVKIARTQSNITWSPATNLYTDAAATVPYVANANSATVYVKSAQAGSQTYTATSVSSFGCIRTATVPVTINALPTVVTNAVTVCAPATVDLTAASVTTGSSSDIVSYTYWSNNNATTPLANPSAVAVSGTYYIVASNANGCSSAITPVTVTVNPLPVLTITNPATACFPATVDLTAAAVTAGSSSTGMTLSYFTDADATVALATPAAVTTSGTYYIKITNNATGCNVISPVVVTIDVTSAPTGAATQTFCGAANLSQLSVTGSNIRWYSAATGGVEYPASIWTAVGLVNGTTYYASQTVNGCQSVPRLAVTVSINATPSAPNASAQSFCGSASVADLVPSGSSLTWYDVATAGSALTSGTALASGTYYVSQTTNGCEGPRTAVAVTVNVTSAPTASAQTFCGPVTVSSLVASGTSIRWYNVATGGAALAGSTSLSTGTYFVTQTLNGCESPRLSVAVTVNTVAAPTGASLQDACITETIADFVVTGDTGAVLTWYATSTSTTSIPTSTPAVLNSFYYVSQTVNGCEGPRLVVIASGPCLGNEEFDMSSFSYYPNPTRDIVNISYSKEITQIKVFNMLGQQVIDTKVNSTTTQVDLSRFATGTYFIEVTSDEVSKTVKVIKN